MAYDLEEQEQLASMKAFWKQYGNMITWVLIIALGSYAAYNFYNSRQRGQAADASNLYDELQRTVGAGGAADPAVKPDNTRVQRIASDIESRFGSTAYAQMGALLAAKSAFDASDLKAAKTQLQWVVDHGNDEYRAVARLRLAGVLLDEKAYDEGLKLLTAEFPAPFAGEVADRKGDILVAQNKLAEARTAYLAALAAMDKRSPARPLVQLKLESIGGTVPEVKADAKAPA
jgi:predicted negative regulator of RcsB-dependent stress response